MTDSIHKLTIWWVQRYPLRAFIIDEYTGSDINELETIALERQKLNGQYICLVSSFKLDSVKIIGESKVLKEINADHNTCTNS